MDEDEQRMRDDLLATTSAWKQRAAKMQAEVTVMYEAKRKRAATLSSIGSGIGVFLLLLGIAAIIAGVGLNNMFWVVLGAMMFLFGDGWISGSKLLYWTFNTRIQVERDIKEMHADVLEIVRRLDNIERMSSRGVSPNAT